MLANILPADAPTPDPRGGVKGRVGSKGQNSTFSVHGHVA